MSQRKKPSHQKEDAKLFDNSLPEFCTYVKSRDHRAGVPDQQIFIKFNNDVVQLQKVEKKLNRQTQNTNNFFDFVVTEFDKNFIHNRKAFISIL
jgi:hypothetical protein